MSDCADCAGLSVRRTLTWSDSVTVRVCQTVSVSSVRQSAPRPPRRCCCRRRRRRSRAAPAGTPPGTPPHTPSAAPPRPPLGLQQPAARPPAGLEQEGALLCCIRHRRVRAAREPALRLGQIRQRGVHGEGRAGLAVRAVDHHQVSEAAVALRPGPPWSRRGLRVDGRVSARCRPRSLRTRTWTWWHRVTDVRAQCWPTGPVQGQCRSSAGAAGPLRRAGRRASTRSRGP